MDNDENTKENVMKKEVTFESAPTIESTHLLRVWLSRSEAFDVATRIMIQMRDPDTKEVGLSLFVKEAKEEDQ